MDVQEFQNKLAELCKWAEEKENSLEVSEIRSFFTGMELEQSQLLKVLQYLKMKGISICGMEAASSGNGETVGEGAEAVNISAEAVPLTPEEKAYYKEYLESVTAAPVSEQSPEELFAELKEGKLRAKTELTARYLPVAAELAVAMNCEEIGLADLIQEANICLLTALEEQEPARKSDAWIRLEIRKGIARSIEEQTQSRYADEQLVEKVQKLETAIRELSEDEDGRDHGFSVNELAIILDMEIEEIRDILRLTGEEG